MQVKRFTFRGRALKGQDHMVLPFFMSDEYKLTGGRALDFSVSANKV